MKIIRAAFFRCVGSLMTWLVLGLRLHGIENLPRSGPCVVTANHNSHLDIFILITVLRQKLPLERIQPVAAADYFGRNRWVRWFTEQIIGAILISRKPGKGEDPLASCKAALRLGQCLIVFPEGSRGEPETFSRFKGGIAHLIESDPDIPVFPLYLHGLGKALPRGEGLLVPFVCDCVVGTPVTWKGDRRSTLDEIEKQTRNLAGTIQVPGWE